MFSMIFGLVISLLLEIILFIFISPELQGNKINYFAVLVFSINTGVLLGLVYSFILIGFYLAIGAYNDLQKRAFTRRGILFGLFISLCLFFKMLKHLDTFLLIFFVIAFITLEVILTQKNEI